jgi:hypothetical protein
VLLGATAGAGATEHVPALILRGVVVVLCVGLWPRAPVRLKRRDLIAPLVAAAAIVTALPAPAHVGPALQAVASTAAIIGLYLTLLATPTDHTGDALLLCGGVATVHSCWALGQWLADGAARGRGGFFNPNDLAAFLAPLAIIAAAAATTSIAGEQQKRRAVLLTAAALLGLGVAATSSRSGLLALGTGLLLLAFGRARKVVLPAALALALLVVVVPGLRARWLGAGDPFAFNRLDIWRASVGVALHEPLGVGLGGYATALRQHGVPLDGPVRYPKVAADAHCEPLTAWVELGVTGLLATLLPPAFLLAVILGRWRRRSTTGPPTALPPAALATLAAFAIPSLLSSSLHVPPIALLAALWAAHVVRNDDTTRPTCRVAPLGWHRALGALALVTALSVALPGAISSVAFERAARARDGGDLEGALTAATLATRAAPWNLGPAMLDESLRFTAGKPPMEVVEALIDLGARFPTEPQPLERAVWILESLPPASAADVPARARILVELGTEITRRDPKNALGFAQLGALQARAGNAAAARATYLAGLTIEPSCGACLAALAAYAQRDGRLDEARALGEQARRADDEASRVSGRAHEILAVPADSLKALMELDYRSP